MDISGSEKWAHSASLKCLWIKIQCNALLKLLILSTFLHLKKFRLKIVEQHCYKVLLLSSLKKLFLLSFFTNNFSSELLMP